MIKLIGLAGRAAAGKSTCSAWLRDNYGAVEYSLAYPLKRLTQEIFSFTDGQVFGSQSEKEEIDLRWGISPREALINLGNGARTWLGEDVWLRACLNTINPDKLSVVNDVRYPNEAHAIKQAGGLVIRLSCPNADTTVNRNAPSERSVDEICAEDLAADITVTRSEGAKLLLSEFRRVFKRLACE